MATLEHFDVFLPQTRLIIHFIIAGIHPTVIKQLSGVKGMNEQIGLHVVCTRNAAATET